MLGWKCVRNVFVCGFRVHSQGCDPRHGEEWREKTFCGNEAKEWVWKEAQNVVLFHLLMGRHGHGHGARHC